MTKRYFYTDPLAAAWMAKHFGMEFRYWKWNNLSFQFLPVNARAVELDSSKLYIHPHCLHLMKGREGDLVRVMANRGFGRIESMITWKDGKTDYRIDTIPAHYYQDEHITILQRNGIAFMWPESEG